MIRNPAGTVGASSNWANQAGLGHPGRRRSRAHPVAPRERSAWSMAGVFAATVEGPWCYLEFGNVQWCRDPTRLDRGLKQAGLKIAGEEFAAAWSAPGGCSEARRPGPAVSRRTQRPPATGSGPTARFSWRCPATAPQRNSINDEGSLLRELCGTAKRPTALADRRGGGVSDRLADDGTGRRACC